MRYRSNNWEGGVQETAPSGSDRILSQQTFSCAHCGGIVIVPFRARAQEIGEFCTRCHRPTCRREACVTKCVPQERMIEEIERNARLEESRRQLLAAIG